MQTDIYIIISICTIERCYRFVDYFVFTTVHWFWPFLTVVGSCSAVGCSVRSSLHTSSTPHCLHSVPHADVHPFFHAGRCASRFCLPLPLHCGVLAWDSSRFWLTGWARFNTAGHCRSRLRLPVPHCTPASCPPTAPACLPLPLPAFAHSRGTSFLLCF
jgi:hypothetical protein